MSRLHTDATSRLWRITSRVCKKTAETCAGNRIAVYQELSNIFFSSHRRPYRSLRTVIRDPKDSREKSQRCFFRLATDCRPSGSRDLEPMSLPDSWITRIEIYVPYVSPPMSHRSTGLWAEFYQWQSLPATEFNRYFELTARQHESISKRQVSLC